MKGDQNYRNNSGPPREEGAPRLAATDPWMAAMRRGDFAAAWQISDAILAARRARGERGQQGPRHLQSVWTGEPLAGKRVCVRCYHGLGDTVQFIRFAAPLRKLATEVTVWAQPQLVALVRSAAGVDRVLPVHDGVPGVPYDCDIEVMELAHALRVDACSIPCEVPYLFPPGRNCRVALGAEEVGVGLVWRAGDWDPQRSVPAELLSPLAHVSGVRLFSLQCGPAAAQASSIPAQDISSEDVQQLAASLRQLDILISVDSFAAHLAGALGVPVWLLLRRECDWRWMDGRRNTVWYPTMHLFRQRRAGDWKGVIAEVARELKKVAAPHPKQKHLEQTCASDVRVE